MTHHTTPTTSVEQLADAARAQVSICTCGEWLRSATLPGLRLLIDAHIAGRAGHYAVIRTP